MFLHDSPINLPSEDRLTRKNFSEHLAKSVLSWDQHDSLVLSLDGEWGTGKSSILNMVIHYLKESQDKSTFIFRFNPWAFSDSGSITGSFFIELAKELQLRNKGKRDKELAEKLITYAALLGAMPEKTSFKSLSDKGLPLLAIAGFSIGGLLKNIPSWLETSFLVLVFLAAVIQLFKEQLVKAASFLELRSKSNEKSLNSLKEEIKNELLKDNRKLVIIIDDMDRLSSDELKQLIKVIRVNADFPNTIYMLAMDRRIVEKLINKGIDLPDRNYLDKIIQVNFTIPLVRQSRIHQTLFTELDRIFNRFEKLELSKQLGQNNTHWAELYNSGFKDLFRSIRDIKRYISGLEFNLAIVSDRDTLEVNLVDFVGIEAVRVFCPRLYDFIKINKELFTSTSRNYLTGSYDTVRQDLLRSALDSIDIHQRGNMESLIKVLFPQIDNILIRGSLSYGSEWQSQWAKTLKICSTRHFESYFALVPGGDESEISNYEMRKIMDASQNSENFESILITYLNQGKIRKLLSDIQNYTDSLNDIPTVNATNIIQSLFNISDNLPVELEGSFDFGADMDVVRVIYQLLKRQNQNIDENYSILSTTIKKSKTLFAPINYLSLESNKEENPSKVKILEEEQIKSLQQLCIDKIVEYDKRNKLMNQRRLVFILYRWKEWDTETGWQSFIEKTTNDINSLLALTRHFYQVSGETNKLDLDSLSNFLNLNFVVEMLKNEKLNNTSIYLKNKTDIDSLIMDIDNNLH